MISYSTNFCGPISMDWYRDRGLTETITQTVESDVIANMKGLEIGDTYEIEVTTSNWYGGRIDIRDDTKEGYDGWDEYALPVMDEKSWALLQNWLDDFESQELVPYNVLIELFETATNHKIVWAKE